MKRLIRTVVVLACLPVLLTGYALAGFHFDVAADMRGYTPPRFKGSNYFAGVCEAISDVGPGAFMVSPGDFDPPHRVRATLDAVLGKGYLWYPVVGNHENEHMVYLRNYNAGGNKLPRIVRTGPPGAVETCYAFDYENAHFVVINQYYDGRRDFATDGNVPDALYKWLAEDLAATDKEIIFVFGHEPSVVIPDMHSGRVRHQGGSLDRHPKNNHRFWTLLRRHDVVAYICGHTHNASVAKINGLWQVDVGHARGKGDTGAKSTFVKIYVTGEKVHCDVYRAAPGKPYKLEHSERLR